MTVPIHLEWRSAERVVCTAALIDPQHLSEIIGAVRYRFILKVFNNEECAVFTSHKASLVPMKLLFKTNFSDNRRSSLWIPNITNWGAVITQHDQFRICNEYFAGCSQNCLWIKLAHVEGTSLRGVSFNFRCLRVMTINYFIRQCGIFYLKVD